MYRLNRSLFNVQDLRFSAWPSLLELQAGTRSGMWRFWQKKMDSRSPHNVNVKELNRNLTGILYKLCYTWTSMCSIQLDCDNLLAGSIEPLTVSVFVCIHTLTCCYLVHALHCLYRYRLSRSIVVQIQPIKWTFLLYVVYFNRQYVVAPCVTKFQMLPIVSPFSQFNSILASVNLMN